MREFEVGEIVHVLSEEPEKPKVEQYGVTYSEWEDANRKYAGVKVRITDKKTDEQNKKYGIGYITEPVEPPFHHAETVPFWYGPDFLEFYVDDIGEEITEEDMLEILG